MPDVRMPDGTIIQNVPEGTTQAELQARLDAMPSERTQNVAARRRLTDVTDLRQAGAEVALNMLTGIPATALSGLAPVERDADLNQVSDQIRNIQRNLTFQPRSRQAVDIQNTIGQAFAPVERLIDVAATGDTSAAPDPGPPGFSTGITGAFGTPPSKPSDPGDARNPLLSTAIRTGIEGLTAFPALRSVPIRRSPRQMARQEVVREGQDQGYRVAPGDAASSGVVQRADSFAGNAPMQRRLQIENQNVTNRLAARSLGLDEGTILNRQRLIAYRAEQGQAYAVLDNLNDVPVDVELRRAASNATRSARQAARDFPSGPRPEGLNTLFGVADDIGNAQSFTGVGVKEQIRQLRDASDRAFANQNASVGRHIRQMADALEDAAERQLVRQGSPGAIEAYRQARQNIARSYTIEDALKGSDVDATRLPTGRPLGDELDLVRRMADEFPQAVRVPKQSARDFGMFESIAALTAGGAGVATGNPMIGLAALLSGSRPIMREVLTGPVGQRMARDPVVSFPFAIPGLIAPSQLAQDDEPQ